MRKSHSAPLPRQFPRQPDSKFLPMKTKFLPIDLFSKIVTLSCGFVVAGLVSQPAHASLWTGAAADNNWDNLSNWDSNPSGGIGQVDTLTAYPIITGANTIVPNDLKIAAANPSSTGRVDIRSGTFTINYWGFVGDYGGNATLNLADTSTSGGTYTGFGTGSGSFTNTANGNGNFMVGLYNSTGVVNMNTSGSLNVTELRLSPNGQAGSATFNLDNGSVNVAGSFAAGSDFWGANTNSPAYLNMSGGSITTGYEFWIGGSGAGTGTMTGGTINSGTWFVVGRNGGSNGTFNLSGGTVNGATANGFTVMGSFAGSTGTLNVSGTGVLNSPREMRIGEGGTGTLVQTGGTVSVGGVTHVGYGGSNTTTQNGTLTVSGGTFTSENDLVLGYAGSSSAQAAVNVNGGTLNVATSIKRWLIVSRYDAVNSTLTVSSGNLNLNAGTDLRFSTYGNAGNNTVTLDGGAITSYSGNQTGDGAGVVDLAQGTGVANNTFNLNGGTLTVRQVVSSTNNGTRTFNLNGGTLRATGTSTAFFSLGTGSARANVRDGGAIIDSNSYDVTIAQALLHSNIGGDAAIDGGLVKNGVGTLTLTGQNTYTGATTVHAGTLALGTGGSIANSGQIVVGDAGSSGAKLDATALPGLAIGTAQELGGIGTVDVGSGKALTINGTLAPGNSIGTLIINGDLVLAGVSDFEINPAGVLADLADVSGNLTYGGTLNVSNIGGSLQWGNTFDLFDWGGALSGGFSSVVLPALPNPNWSWQNNLLTDGTITVVPEPATTIGLSLLLCGALLRRRRHS